jgi:hypothetical protein
MWSGLKKNYVQLAHGRSFRVSLDPETREKTSYVVWTKFTTVGAKHRICTHYVFEQKSSIMLLCSEEVSFQLSSERPLHRGLRHKSSALGHSRGGSLRTPLETLENYYTLPGYVLYERTTAGAKRESKSDMFASETERSRLSCMEEVSFFSHRKVFYTEALGIHKNNALGHTCGRSLRPPRGPKIIRPLATCCVDRFPRQLELKAK